MQERDSAPDFLLVSGPMAEFGDLRILDLSTEIAGPYATKLFADAGATVIKIETPPRRCTASLEPQWHSSARGKR